MGNPQERQERKEARRDYRMEAKNMRADHRDAIRNVNRAIKGERLEDRLQNKQQKLQFRKEMEDLKSGYAGTFHRKLNRLSDKIKHGQAELQDIRHANQEFKANKLNMEGYDSKAHKKSLKRKHKELMQEQKGKHRLLRKKTDIHINTDVDANRHTDVDVNVNKTKPQTKMLSPTPLYPSSQKSSNKATGELGEIMNILPEIGESMAKAGVSVVQKAKKK